MLEDVLRQKGSKHCVVYVPLFSICECNILLYSKITYGSILVAKMTLHHHSKAISALAALPVIAHGAFGGDEGATDSGIWKVRGEDLYIYIYNYISYNRHMSIHL